MSTGKFHGRHGRDHADRLLDDHDPLRVVRSCVEGSTWPRWRSMSSEARRKWSTVNSTISSRDSRIVLPTSRVIICAISSERSMQMSNARRQSSTRSSSGVAPGREGGLGRRARPRSTCAGDDAEHRFRAARRWRGSGPRSPRRRRHPLAADEGAGGVSPQSPRRAPLVRSMTLGRSFLRIVRRWVVTAGTTARGGDLDLPADLPDPSAEPRARPAPPVGRRAAPAGASHLADGAAGTAHIAPGAGGSFPSVTRVVSRRAVPGRSDGSAGSAAERRLGSAAHAVEAELVRSLAPGCSRLEQDQARLPGAGSRPPQAVGLTARFR